MYLDFGAPQSGQEAGRQCLAILAAKIQSREIVPERIPALRRPPSR